MSRICMARRAALMHGCVSSRSPLTGVGRWVVSLVLVRNTAVGGLAWRICLWSMLSRRSFSSTCLLTPRRMTYNSGVTFEHSSPHVASSVCYKRWNTSSMRSSTSRSRDSGKMKPLTTKTFSSGRIVARRTTSMGK